MIEYENGGLGGGAIECLDLEVASVEGSMVTREAARSDERENRKHVIRSYFISSCLPSRYSTVLVLYVYCSYVVISCAWPSRS